MPKTAVQTRSNRGRTTLVRKEDVAPAWFVVDADSQIVGRLATSLATVLMGKHKPDYTPHVDTGDFIIVLNAKKVRFSGKSLAHPEHPKFTVKFSKKVYERYTGYPSGRRFVSGTQMKMNTAPSMQTAPYLQKVPELPNARLISGKE